MVFEVFVRFPLVFGFVCHEIVAFVSGVDFMFLRLVSVDRNLLVF